MASGADTLDAATFLARLVAPCDGPPDAHGWRKCRRCIALHLLQQRDPKLVAVLELAVAELRKETTP